MAKNEWRKMEASFFFLSPSFFALFFYRSRRFAEFIRTVPSRKLDLRFERRDKRAVQNAANPIGQTEHAAILGDSRYRDARNAEHAHGSVLRSDCRIVPPMLSKSEFEAFKALALANRHFW